MKKKKKAKAVAKKPDPSGRLEHRNTPGHIAVLIFTLAYILIGGIYFYVAGVKEFIFYLLILLVVVGLVVWQLPRLRIPTWGLFLLSVLGLLHALGGGVKVNGDVLYNYVIIPIINNGPNGITFWRYDQLVHPYGTAIVAILIYFLIARASKLPRVWMVVIAALAAMGIGALNEVVEFIATVIVPHTDVGGYDNTALDLCSNTVGSLFGAAFAAIKWGKKPPTY